ncbi:fimbrial protein [Escherichia coli]|uniref:fimbrial protein n=1 Tax=Escherichia coli TaxID=562 RepID=UPI0003EF7C1D|nr:fimbrial protein [Escherichia coli]
MRKLCLPFAIATGFFALAANASNIQRTIITADVVASACHVSVDADGSGRNSITFDTYNKSSGECVQPREFTIRMYETGASVLGCSAFLAGEQATLEFGNPGQLDSGGIVTRGAGDDIRIEVRGMDPQADYKGPITSGNSKVNYPVDFAAKGQFRFKAQPLIPKNVKTGEYTGALSFVVTYH